MQTSSRAARLVATCFIAAGVTGAAARAVAPAPPPPVVSAAAPPAAPVPDYAVRLTRPAVVGEKRLAVGSLQSDDHLAGSKAGAPSDERQTATIRYVVATEILEVSAKGNALRATLTVRRLTKESGGSSLELAKPGDFVASGGIKGTDGKIHAVEVRIFPEPLRGTGEGQRPWAAKPDGMMTNATVGTVTQSPDGGVVHVTYKEGESEYVVGPDVPVLAYIVADRSLLKPGAAVLIFAQKQPDGTLQGRAWRVGRDGVTPPM